MRVLVLEYQRDASPLAAALAPRAGLLLHGSLDPGLAGDLSDYAGPCERIRYGFPRDSTLDFFRVMDPRPGRPTCASIAVARTVFARGIGIVTVGEAALVPFVRHALATHDITVFLGTEARHASTLGGYAVAPAVGAGWQDVARAVLAHAGPAT